MGTTANKNENGHYEINQEQYIEIVVNGSGLEECKISEYPLDPGYYKLDCEHYLPNNDEYRKLIGMLLYISTNSRPDILMKSKESFDI